MSKLNKNYYTKQIASIKNEINKPRFYKWLSKNQISKKVTSQKYINVTKYEAFLDANPTTLANEVNEIATIGFKSEAIRLNYLKLQYQFRHLKQTSRQDYENDNYAGDVNNNLLPFGKAYKLASNEIIKLIDQFILTGTVTIRKDGKNKKHLLPNMYGLLNIPDQIDEEVSNDYKDNINKIFEKIEEGLSKLKIGYEFSTPFMVLVDPLTSLKLVKPYGLPNASSSSNSHIYSSTDLWEDLLIKTIKAINNREKVYLETSNLLKNQIIIYPLNPKLIRLEASKYMLPTLNKYVEKNSTDIEYSYLDFVLGGLLATDKTILRININENENL